MKAATKPGIWLKNNRNNGTRSGVWRDVRDYRTGAAATQIRIITGGPMQIRKLLDAIECEIEIILDVLFSKNRSKVDA